MLSLKVTFYGDHLFQFAAKIKRFGDCLCHHLHEMLFLDCSRLQYHDDEDRNVERLMIRSQSVKLIAVKTLSLREILNYLHDICHATGFITLYFHLK